jgi:hypothetical protein
MGIDEHGGRASTPFGIASLRGIIGDQRAEGGALSEVLTSR